MSVQFEKVLKSCAYVALARVCKFSKAKAMVSIEIIDNYRGSLTEIEEIGVPTMWGKYRDDWFKKGESCIVMVLPSKTIYGKLGRMPVFEFNGQLTVESYCEDLKYFGEFEIANDESRNLILLDDFKKYFSKL